MELPEIKGKKLRMPRGCGAGMSHWVRRASPFMVCMSVLPHTPEETRGIHTQWLLKGLGT